MITLKEIEKQAHEIKNILSFCTTIEDLRNLRHIGINEDDIDAVMKPDGDFIPLKDLLLNVKDYNTSIVAIRITDYPDSNIDFPTYYVNSKVFYFDVFDAEINDYEAFIQDTTLATLKQDYYKALIFEHKDDIANIVLPNLTPSEIFTKMNENDKESLYHMFRYEHVYEDVANFIVDEDIELSDENISEVANRYVYDGDYDPSLSYWDNIKNLIDDVSE